MYTAPSTVSTGDLATADIQNTQIVASIVALYAGEMSIASQAIGDLLYASSTTQWARIADVAVGQVLVSGGVGVAPAWSATPTFVATNVTGIPAAQLTGTITSATQDLITRTGTITSGVWNAGAVTSSGIITGTVGMLQTGSVLSRFEGAGNTVSGGSGAGIEFYAGGVQAYNRTTVAYAPFALDASAFTSIGSWRMSDYGAGTATFDASGNITSVSDERQKDVQGPFAPGLNALLALRPIRFTYTEASGLDTENVYAGFSAQNVMQYVPEAVGKNVNGLYSLNVIPLVAATITAVQELATEVNELRAVLRLSAKDRTIPPVIDEARIVVSPSS